MENTQSNSLKWWRLIVIVYQIFMPLYCCLFLLFIVFKGLVLICLLVFGKHIWRFYIWWHQQTQSVNNFHIAIKHQISWKDTNLSILIYIFIVHWFIKLVVRIHTEDEYTTSVWLNIIGANFIEISCLTETHQDLGRTLLVDNNHVSLVWIWAI